MSAEALHHLMQLPYRHFERTPSGIIAERLRQLDVLRNFLTGQMPVLAIDIAFVALFLAATFAISATLGSVAALAIPVLVCVSLATHRAQRRLAEENFQALAAKSSTLAETVANAATIKTLGLEAELRSAGRRGSSNRPGRAVPTASPISPPAPRAACSSGIVGDRRDRRALKLSTGI
jgi:ABC-type bacteriocin/lantibiotic exporter with double-glycine peptidase domain